MPTTGGFIQPPHHPHPGLLSPPSTIASTSHHFLPHPRTHPLRPGGTKEADLIRYVDDTLLLIKRRWAKRHFADERAGSVKGYHSFAELAGDLDGVVGVVWVSGTPALQIPYLLSIALALTEFLPSFPAAPRAMFRLLEKLDLAFATLLLGRDPETGEELPGIGRRGVRTTEKIRMKSLVERTRVVVVDVMDRRAARGSFPHTEADGDDMDSGDIHRDVDAEGDVDMETDGEGEEERGWGEEDEEDEWEMAIGRVYERTIGELGESVEGPPIGIITNG